MAGSRNTYTIQDILEGKAEEKWRRDGVPERDIEFSRLTGMDAGDIRGIRKFTAQHPGYLIFVRCPKATARPHYHNFPSKPGYATGKESKSGDSGLALVKRERELPDGSKITKGKWVVSDYDLMSFWRGGRNGLEKVEVTSGEFKAGQWIPKDGAKKGPLSPQSTALIAALNRCMESRARIMHGCQDDWKSLGNRGVMAGDRFAAFNLGSMEYFDGPSALGYYYRSLGLKWPYDGAGKYKLT
jgi:hypothetical protein